MQVRGAAVVEQRLDALLQLGQRAPVRVECVLVRVLEHEADRLLRGQHVPDAVARQQHELRVDIYRLCLDVGLRGHCLVLLCDICVRLVLEVA